MDRRNNRQWTGEKMRSWHTKLSRSKATIERFIRQRQHALISACLLGVALMLLMGIASQLPAPATKTPPPGLLLDDRSLLQEVQAGHVLAVIVQGDELHGLLDVPFSGNAHSTTVRTASSRRNDAGDIATWHTYVLTGYHLPPAPPRNDRGVSALFAGPIDPQRMVFIWLLPGQATSLLPVLLRHHVIVQTLPEQAMNPRLRWTALVLAFVLMTLPLLLTYTTGSLSSSGSNRERMTRFRQCRVQRRDPTMLRQSPYAALPALPIATEGGVLLSSEETITFADVAGIDEVRADLEEIVEFLRHSERVGRLGARLPRGILLSGPPGTGKTLLARALAGEAGVPFFSLSASSFVEVFVGIGASRVRDLFTQARQAAPCVIFLDELDAVGGKRATNQFFNDEREQTLNQLLVELDGFAPRDAVIVLAATNRADKLDAALLRPGRFDRQLTVSLPDRAGREAILRVHTRRTPLREDVSLPLLARLTVGMSGADLANLVNEAAITAARRDLDQLTPECFGEAMTRMQVGARRVIVMSEAERRVVAYHEAGHALVAHYTPHADAVDRVSILPHGQKIGATHLLAEEDRFLWSRKALLARIVVGLGGRAAEELTFGAHAVTTGTEDDLQTVTDIARRMVTRWGMSERIGPLFVSGEPTQYEPALSQRPFGNSALREGVEPASPPAPSSPTMATEIDCEVRRLLCEGYQHASTILEEHSDQLARLAEALLQYEQLDQAQFELCLQSVSDLIA